MGTRRQYSLDVLIVTLGRDLSAHADCHKVLESQINLQDFSLTVGFFLT